MPEPSYYPEADLEEIVAYLDGELPAAESARVERRLASDEAYRQQLQSVERAWAALDELPMATVDDKFSRTTMQLTVQVAAEEVQQLTVAMPRIRRRHRLSTFLAAAAAMALGFLVFQLARQNPNQMLLADLPVIDNVDVYTQFEDTSFLQTIDRELGDEFRQMQGESSDLAARMVRFETVASPANREQWLRSLSDADRTSLRAKFNRFRELPPPEQQRLRDLAADISRLPEAEKLHQTMLLYQEWLGGLPPPQQFELRTLPAAERVRTAKDWVDKSRDDALLSLSSDELKVLTRKVRKPLEELLRSATHDLNVGDHNHGPRNSRPPFPSVGQLRRELTIQFARDVALPGKFQSVVIEALPERAQAPFSQLPPREKIERFMTWMRQVEALRGNVPQQELERFFAEELDAESRAELLSLPPGEMEQALKQRYRRQPGQGFAGAGGWNARGDYQQRGRRQRGDGPPERGPRPEFPPGREFDGPGGTNDFRPDGPPRDGGPPDRFGPPPNDGRRRPPRPLDGPHPGDPRE